MFLTFDTISWIYNYYYIFKVSVGECKNLQNMMVEYGGCEL